VVEAAQGDTKAATKYLQGVLARSSDRFLKNKQFRSEVFWADQESALFRPHFSFIVDHR